MFRIRYLTPLVFGVFAVLLTAVALPRQTYVINAGAQPTVCLRDGSCIQAGATSTVVVTPDGTRPPTVVVTVTPSPTSARSTATATATGTPCVVTFRDGSSLPCGSTATRTP